MSVPADRFPLAEVLGKSAYDTKTTTKKFRQKEECPFSNGEDACSKLKRTTNAICSINHTPKGKSEAMITCPERFTEGKDIFQKTAYFLSLKEEVPSFADYYVIKEKGVKITKDGDSRGMVDYIVVANDPKKKPGKDKGSGIIDFAPLEVQSIYTSGKSSYVYDEYFNNNQNPFDLKKHLSSKGMKTSDYTTADITSSVKRIVFQFLSKGRVFKSWNKRQCIATQKQFFDHLGFDVRTVSAPEADVAWLLYDLKGSLGSSSEMSLKHVDTLYCKYDDLRDDLTNFFESPDKNDKNYKRKLHDRLLKDLRDSNKRVIQW
jgi:hypothetical protein